MIQLLKAYNSKYKSDSIEYIMNKNTLRNINIQIKLSMLNYTITNRCYSSIFSDMDTEFLNWCIFEGVFEFYNSENCENLTKMLILNLRNRAKNSFFHKFYVKDFKDSMYKTTVRYKDEYNKDCYISVFLSCYLFLLPIFKKIEEYSGNVAEENSEKVFCFSKIKKYFEKALNPIPELITNMAEINPKSSVVLHDVKADLLNIMKDNNLGPYLLEDYLIKMVNFFEADYYF